MKTPNIKITLLTILLSSCLALSACQEKGPAEKAGEKLDNMVEDSRDAIEDAAEDVEDAADDFKKEMEGNN